MTKLRKRINKRNIISDMKAKLEGKRTETVRSVQLKYQELNAYSH